MIGCKGDFAIDDHAFDQFAQWTIIVFRQFERAVQVLGFRGPILRTVDQIEDALTQLLSFGGIGHGLNAVVIELRGWISSIISVTCGWAG